MRIILGFLFLLANLVVNVGAYGSNTVAMCDGPYSGAKLTQKTLDTIVKKHNKWLTINYRERLKNKKDERYANLCGASLVGLSLAGKNLAYADLSWADLTDANLTEADLYNAKFTGATLAASADPADIFSNQRAKLIKANLTNADLTGANLQGADLQSADLIGAILIKTNLRGNLKDSNLSKANLTEANLYDTPLNNALLDNANLTGADLRWARLHNSSLRKTNLNNANLEGAVLENADLTSANLTGANLTGSILTSAQVVETDLSGARLKGVNFTNAQYQAATAPAAGYLGGIRGITTIRHDQGQQVGLVLLRSALKEAGLRQLEREVTFVIERGKTDYAPFLEQMFRLIFFEWTTEYGLHPERALLILLAGIGCFTIFYLYPISPLGLRGHSFVFIVWPSDRILLSENNEPTTANNRAVERLTARGLWLVWYAFFFSLISAFHLGWRELNVGNWISRMQPKQYVFQAVGWARVLSGFQAVMSVYLIAIWALTYFGRPFE